jgi:hypothetical protein
MKGDAKRRLSSSGLYSRESSDRYSLDQGGKLNYSYSNVSFAEDINPRDDEWLFTPPFIFWGLISLALVQSKHINLAK